MKRQIFIAVEAAAAAAKQVCEQLSFGFSVLGLGFGAFWGLAGTGKRLLLCDVSSAKVSPVEQCSCLSFFGLWALHEL